MRARRESGKKNETRLAAVAVRFDREVAPLQPGALRVEAVSEGRSETRHAVARPLEVVVLGLQSKPSDTDVFARQGAAQAVLHEVASKVRRALAALVSVDVGEPPKFRPNGSPPALVRMFSVP